MNEEDLKLETRPPTLVRRRLTSSDMRRLNLPERHWRARFDAVQDGKHKEIVRRYLEQLPSMLASGVGLMLWGSNGVGKTSAAAVIAKESMRLGRTCYFTRASDFRDCVFGYEMFDPYITVRQRAREVDLLVLDDLGKEGADQRGSAERLFEDLIRQRVAEKRSTIITTNLSKKDFVSPEKGGYRTSFIAALKGTVLPVRFEGEDMRVAEAKQLEKTLGVES